MPFLSVCVVVIDEDTVLLTKRDDFHVWCLPSGGVDEGETVVETGIRETREETGMVVKITRLVGIYSRPADQHSGHAVVFAAIPVGGEMRTQPGETLEVRYFPVDDLPSALSFGHRRRILDAVQGVSGAVVMQRPADGRSFYIDGKQIYALRDASGLSPEAFYQAYFTPDEIEEVRVL